ncbi:PHD-finger domain-containing protein [Phthorimaea operculella]|nr:PHD-finger domain-containing protein [Phthorimaea operculella]
MRNFPVMSALKDVSRRWHIPPAFSVEFVGYYLERNARVTSLRQSLERLTKENEKMLAEDESLRADYDEASKQNAEKLAELTSTRQSLKKIYDAIVAICPKKVPPAILEEKPLLPPELPRSTPKVTPQQLQKRSMSVPTAAALKMGVGFPLSDNPDARHGKVLSTSLEASRYSRSTGATTGAVAGRECCVCGDRSEAALMAACDTCSRHYHLHCLNPPLQRPPKKSKLYGWQCSECDKTSDSEPEVMEKKVPRRSRIRYSKDGAIIHEPASPPSATDSPPKKDKDKAGHHKTDKITKVATPSASNASPIKVTIKPFDFSSENESELKKKEKKIKKSKSKDHATEGDIKKLKRSFTSPNLTNTPLMSITPIVADSPNDSHNENSNQSVKMASAKDAFASPSNLSFSSLLGEAKEKERDSKTIESSIENTLANLSSDIATYKANRKRRKEKHRSRYSPDLLRSPSKHKHKRKKKTQDMENPNTPHPRITIKIKPIPKPDGSLDTQMFYVPTDSNDGPPPAIINKHKHAEHEATAAPAPPPDDTPTATTTPVPTVTQEEKPPPESKQKAKAKTVTPPTKPKRQRAGRSQGGSETTTPTAALTPLTQCDVCNQPGNNTNIVRCDECNKRYHFTCLEPPLNKNPKKRGYSWHCADCDPTDPEENN